MRNRLEALKCNHLQEFDREVFDFYLAEVDKEHRYLSGLNLLADLFNEYFI